MGEPDVSPVEAAFRRARIAVAEHTDAMAAAGTTWREETITELVLARAHPDVHFADFSRGEEALVGADWLWWWVGDDGESFGTLVQAKNLTFTAAGTPRVAYQHNQGRQLAALLNSSNLLEVPAMYAVYMGGIGYRRGWRCKQDSPDYDDERRAISMVPALAFTDQVTPTNAAERTCEFGLPLETLTGSETWWHAVGASRLRLTHDLHEFLSNPQRGPRAIARAVMGMVSLRRAGQFGLAVIQESAPMAPIASSDEDVTSARVFSQLPLDEMHDGTRYYDHVLRGLRSTPPGYVLDVLNGVTPEAGLVERVAGVVVVPI